MLQTKAAESRSYGNKEVCDLLEGWLEIAREGKICHVTLVAQQLPNILAVEFAGIADCEHAVPSALDVAKIKMYNRIRTKAPPIPLPSVPYNCFCYNLPSMPVSYDFFTWLINAEMVRVREGAEGPLKIAFVSHQLGGAQMQMYSGVMRPLLPMMGAIETDEALHGRTVPLVCKPIVEAARRGEKVPLLKPIPEAMEYVASELKGRKPIVITMREMRVWEHRNSNFDAWTRFAKELQDQGEFVVFVRDTAKAEEPVGGTHLTFPLAAVNIHVRVALYEQAKLNMFVPNGPSTLATHGTRPYLIFNGTSLEDPYHFNRAQYWKSEFGMEQGDQWPWALPTQRLTWEHDDYENIVKHYEAIKDLL